MKLALVQQASAEYAPLLQATIAWHAKFCERHDHIYLPSFGEVIGAKTPYWGRYPLLVETLRAGFADIVVWMDADCVIADGNTSLLEAASEFMLIGAVAHPDPFKDWGFHYNAGVLFLRRTERTIKFLEKMLSVGDIPGEQWLDQATLLSLSVSEKMPICRISHKWNSTSSYNDCINPVIKAFHGRDHLKYADVKELTAVIKAIADRNLGL
jgi:hypothetical protein